MSKYRLQVRMTIDAEMLVDIELKPGVDIKYTLGDAARQVASDHLTLGGHRDNCCKSVFNTEIHDWSLED